LKNLWVAVLAGVALIDQASSAAALRDGFYYINGPKNKGTYSFALKERPDKNVDFGVSLWWPDGKNVAISGVAQPVGNGWRYSDVRSPDPGDRCIIDILPENDGYRLKIDRDAHCQSRGGFQAVPSEVAFSKQMRQGNAAHILEGAETFINTECKAKPATKSPPLEVGW